MDADQRAGDSTQLLPVRCRTALTLRTDDQHFRLLSLCCDLCLCGGVWLVYVTRYQSGESLVLHVRVTWRQEKTANNTNTAGPWK